MFNAFDPAPIYALLGAEVVHLPLVGGEVSGLAVLDLPGKSIFDDQVMVVEPTLRFPTGTFDAKRGDTFVIDSEAWIVADLPRQIFDGAEACCHVVKQ